MVEMFCYDIIVAGNVLSRLVPVMYPGGMVIDQMSENLMQGEVIGGGSGCSTIQQLPADLRKVVHVRSINNRQTIPGCLQRVMSHPP
jgi:hypothetical protein